VVSSLVANGLVREDVEPLGLRDTRALDVEFHDLGVSTEEFIDRLVSRAVQLVHRVRVGIVPSGVGVDGLHFCMLIGEVRLGELPLDLDALPPKSELDCRPAVLGGDTAVVDDNVHLVLRPLGVGVDGKPLGLSERPEGGGRARALLIVGSVDDDVVFPRHLGAGLLLGGGGGGLLG